MTTYADLTRAEQRTLVVLSDRAWHRGSRTGDNGTVLGTPGFNLCRLGLAEREGASRTARPRNPGFSYRITPAGLDVLQAESDRLGQRSIVAEFVHDDDDCPACHGSGIVCEDHPGRPWDEGDGCCGAAGMPCPLRPGAAP